MSEKCTWYQADYEDGAFHTDCGYNFIFDDGVASDNNFNFCPKCGKVIEEILWTNEDEQEDTNDGN